MNRLLLMVITLCISCLVIAQEKGVEIQWVERIPMGDGRMVYRYMKGDKKHLEGECRLTVSEREYILADFKDGFPDGKWETYRYNKLYEKRQYKDGRINGKVTTYGSDGKTVISESTSTSGKRNGRYATYYANGTLSKEQEYKEGKEHGYLRTYDQEGNIKWDCNYEEGKMHGRQVQLFISSLDGHYVKTSNYKHGTLVGDYLETYEGGALKQKGTYDSNGKKTGVWTSGTKSGRITEECEYKNDERNGDRKSFFSDNTVSKIERYKNSKLNGVTIEYSGKTNKVERETTYVDGRKDGPFKVFHEDGKTVKIEGKYVSGNVASQKQYYSNGKLRLVQEREGNGFKTLEEYDENGKKK